MKSQKGRRLMCGIEKISQKAKSKVKREK